jgi:hypothetical protein
VSRRQGVDPAVAYTGAISIPQILCNRGDPDKLGTIYPQLPQLELADPFIKMKADRSPSLLGPDSTEATSVVRGATLNGFQVEVEEAAVAVVDRTPVYRNNFSCLYHVHVKSSLSLPLTTLQLQFPCGQWRVTHQGYPPDWVYTPIEHVFERNRRIIYEYGISNM